MGRTVWTTRQIAEAASQRGRPVTAEYIRQLCKRGAIVAEKPSHDWLIPTWQAEKWLEDWLKRK